MNGKKNRKAFYARKSTRRKLTELAKNVQPFRNSEACLLGVQTSSGCISINLYSADKKKLILIFIGFEAATSPFPHSMLLLVSARSCWSH